MLPLRAYLMPGLRGRVFLEDGALARAGMHARAFLCLCLAVDQPLTAQNSSCIISFSVSVGERIMLVGVSPRVFNPAYPLCCLYMPLLSLLAYIREHTINLRRRAVTWRTGKTRTPINW